MGLETKNDSADEDPQQVTAWNVSLSLEGGRIRDIMV
jgi:hypothetical protein